MSYKVLIPLDISEIGKRYLRDKGYEIKMGRGLDEKTIMEDVVDCDALLARNEPITRNVMEAGKQLKVISKHGVGLDKIDITAAADLGIWVTNGPLSNAVAVAEHTMMLMLAAAKKLIVCDKEMRLGNYGIRNEVKGMDLEGKTIGLIGLGKIGGMVAQKSMYGFGMKVIGYDPFLPVNKRNAEIEYLDDIEEVFRRGDFISLHMPATAETKGLVNAKLISLMKPTAYLINVARGEVMDEEALCEALKKGSIAGAALDVYNPEPPLKENPLFGYSNCICTPHNAALTVESIDRMGLHAAQGIDEVLTSKQPTWPVVTPYNPKQKVE